MDAVSRQRSLAQVLLILGYSGRAAPYTTYECFEHAVLHKDQGSKDAALLSICALQARLALARIPVNQFFELPGRPTVVFQASSIDLLGRHFQIYR